MVESVLVTSMGEILGDGVYKLQLLPALAEAFPGAALVWYAGEQGSVYQTSLAYIASRYITEIITDPASGARPFRSLFNFAPFRGHKFDVVIDTQSLLVPALIAKRAAQGVFVSSVGNYALSDYKHDGPAPKAMIKRLEGLVFLASGKPAKARMPEVTDETSLAAAKALLPDGPVYVGFAPGAGEVQKRWPLERYREVATSISADGAIPVFLIGPAEAEMEPILRAALPQALFPEANRKDDFQHIKGPRLGFALATQFKAALANDSGIGHVIGAGGAPLLTLFPNMRKAMKFPTASPRPIALAADTFGTEGMAAIPVNAVKSALKSLLAGA